MRSAILLLLIVCVIHLPTLRGEFVWDDEDTVIADPCPDISWWRLFLPAEFQQCAGELGYRPLVAISHDFDTAVWGDRPAGHHLTNVILHSLVALLLFMLIRDIGYTAGTAAIGTLLVSVHPLTVEPVSAISFRTDIMATLCMVGTLLFARRSRFVPALLAMICALLCKETALLLPIMVLLVTKRRNLPLTVAMTVLSAAFILLRFGFYRSPGEAELQFIGGSFETAFANAPVMLFRAVGHFFYPRPCPDRSSITLASHHSVIASWIGLVVGLLGLFYLFKKRRRMARWLGVILLLFLPFLGLYPLKMVLADRYLYAPLMFAGIPLASLVHQCTGRWKYALLCLILCCEIWISLMTQPMWWNEEILFRKTALCAPESEYARFNYGLSLVRLGRYEEAKSELNSALSIMPSFKQARLNLGVAHFYTADYREAINSYRLAEGIGGQDPRIAVNIARAYLGMADTTQAVKELNRALSLDPEHDMAVALRDSILENRNSLP
jgi:hypothetical protein